MPIRIAIPEPSSDPEYNQRSLPPYREALEAAGATAVIVPLNVPQERVAKLLAGVQGILLPGSRYDVDPERYGEERIPECGEADPARTAADELLLQDAFNLRKPILAICHGAQTLNVWCNGTLVQHLKTQVNHSPGRQIAKAHPVRIAEESRLAGILAGAELPEVQVNSSHHQAIRVPGDKLRVSAVSPDGVIEAVELDEPGHFVLGVQWHPERTYKESESSRRIFAAFLKEAEGWRPPAVNDSVARDSVAKA
jgi:putative glutamine amidotransferase